MAAGNQVTLTFAGDSQSLEKTFANVGDAARKMGGDLDSADGKARGLDGAMGTVGSTVDSSESKFMGTADVLDGLATTMGLNIDSQINFARGMGDIAGGLTNLGPLLSGMASKLGLTSAATWAWNTAQTALNLVMSLNPIMLVVIAIGLLVAGFIVAYKNSESFREIVQGAMDRVKEAVGWVVDKFQVLWNFIKDLPGKVADAFRNLADIIKGPFTSAFDAVKNLWNSTIGGFRISIPDWVPVVGGKGFDFPRMHMGGIVPGNPGQVVPILAMAGETMGRAGGGGGGNHYSIVVQSLDPAAAAPLVVRAIDEYEARNGTRYARA